MNEYGLQAGPTHFDVIHGSAGGADAVEQRRKIGGNVGHPGTHLARVGRIDLDAQPRDLVGRQRRVQAERDQPMAANGLIDELRERPRRDHAAVVDDHRPRAAGFRLLEVMRRQEQRHAFGRKLAERDVDAVAALGIDADGRLVEQNDRG